MRDASTSAAVGPRRRIPVVGLASTALAVGGLLLAAVTPWAYLVVAAAMFGPGLLRESGWLRDHDEFQRQAAHRAGYHAFLAAGFAAFAVFAFLRSGGRAAPDAADAPALIAAVLWFTWALSSLVTYWGAEIAATRLLRGFGTLWLGFAIVANTGSEWTGWSALAIHALLALPFFGLAWAAPRNPRAAGAALLAAAVAACWLLGLPGNPNLGLLTRGFTLVLFVGPLVASGVALLTVPRE